MSLRSDWRLLVRRAWSVRLMALAGALTGLEAVFSTAGADWLPVPTWARMLLIFGVIGGAFAARLIAQKDMQ